jgi:ADP-heptose:LPS heptosyltransferase
MNYKKILAVKMRSFGDTILLTAPLAALRRQYPRAEIHVVVTSTWASILDHHPGVDRIWSYERHKEKTSRAKTIARMAYQLRQENFDCVVNFHASPSSAMLSFATGAKTRAIHFHGHDSKNRYSTVEIQGKGTPKPIIERDMDTIRAIGVHIPEGRLPKIFLEASEFIQGEQYLQNLNFSEPILALGLGASRPTKIWPIDRFASLAVSWVQQTGGSVLAIAGPGEEALAQEFNQSVEDQTKLLGKKTEAETQLLRRKIQYLQPLPIRQLAGILRQCRVFCGNDSGPKHLAIAVETPTVTMIGPEHPFEWHPYPRDLHPYFFIEELGCRKDGLPGMPQWCGLQACVVERHKCMHLIRVDQVLEECKRVASL